MHESTDRPSYAWNADLVCPSWCVSLHETIEPVRERVHHAEPSADVPLSLVDPDVTHIDGRGVGEQPSLMVGLSQHVRESEPHVELVPEPVRADLPRLQLTADEAAEVGRALLAAVEQAR